MKIKAKLLAAFFWSLDDVYARSYTHECGDSESSFEEVVESDFYKVSCTCTEDEDGEPLFVGGDCSIEATNLQSVKDTNEVLLNALTVSRE